MGVCAVACESKGEKETKDENLQRMPDIPMVFENNKVEQIEIEYIKGPLLGQGGFAKVWSALRIPDGALIAVKEIEVHQEDSFDQVAKEGTVLARLNHRHILKYYGMKIFEKKRQVKIYTEYCSGITMNKLRSFQNKMDKRFIRVWMYQLFDAVAYCHERRVCHQDLKPQNIFVTPDGVKIIDFGSATLSTISFPSPTPNKKISTNYEFTVLYVAPEALKTAMGVGHKSEVFEMRVKMDVWSLGCVMVELTTEKEVWSELNFENGFVASYRISDTDITPKWDESVLSAQGNAFIGMLLIRDPLKRPSAAELLENEYLRSNIQIKDIKLST